MTPPISSVVRVAKSPEQAKIFVALLAGEGIPAHIEGEGLTDEFAMSRRMVNLVAVRVMVPTTSLERARDLLAEAQVEDSELERQALAADAIEAPPEPQPTWPRPAEAPPRRSHWPLIVAIAAAAVFFALWMREAERRLDTEDPFFVFEPFPGGMHQILRATGKPVADLHDDNNDGGWDRFVIYDADGEAISTNTDQDKDGLLDRCVELRDGMRITWLDGDGDQQFERGEVTDLEGNLVHRIVWKAGTGFVIEKR